MSSAKSERADLKLRWKSGTLPSRAAETCFAAAPKIYVINRFVTELEKEGFLARVFGNR